MKRILFALLTLCLATSCFLFPALATQAAGDIPPLLIAPLTTEAESPPDSAAVEIPTIDQISPTVPEPLPFSDLSGHWAEATLRKAVTDGYLTGFSDGTMRPDAPITKAEIVSILTRVLPAPGLDSSHEKSSRADAFALLDEMLLLSPGMENISLAAYSDAGKLRTDERAAVSALLQLGAIHGYTDGTLRPENNISRAEFLSLLYALPQQREVSKNLTFVQSESARLRYLVPLDTVTLKDGVKLSTLVLGPASNPKLTLGKDSSIDHLILTGDGRNISIPAGVFHVTLLRATGNTLTVEGSLDELVLLDGCNTIDGKGTVKSLMNYYASNTITVKTDTIGLVKDAGIENLVVTLQAPQALPVGSLLRVTALLPKRENTLDCAGLWIVDDKVVKQDAITLSPDGGSTEYLASFEYKQTMNTDFNIRFELFYVTRDGIEQKMTAKCYTKLENYPAAYYERHNPDKVLSCVSTGYQGDYTLAWAQNNDYDTLTKEIWVNTKGYTSKTKYLVWINIATQHVNIFEGSKANWKLAKNYIVGSGRAGTDTPVGVYTVGTRTASGWTTDIYTVRPVLRFKMGSGLAFHSRIYNPKYTRITDASIGYPVSHGCIRMYDDDVWWMYENIPEGTTVVVY